MLEIVNLRAIFSMHGPAEGSIEAQVAALSELQRQSLVSHIGLSTVTPAQFAEGGRIAEIACVEDHYNLVHRDDDAMADLLAAENIPCVPYFPLGGFSPLQSETLSEVARSLGATAMQVALAGCCAGANILLIPGTSSRAHLHENLAAAELALLRRR